MVKYNRSDVVENCCGNQVRYDWVLVMVGDFSQEFIKGCQSRITLRLVVRKSLVESVHMFYLLFTIQIVVDSCDNGKEKTDPHPVCGVGNVTICAGCYPHSMDDERGEGKLPLHRNATVDDLLEAFFIQCLIEHVSAVLHATPLKKLGDGLANVGYVLQIEIQILVWL